MSQLLLFLHDHSSCDPHHVNASYVSLDIQSQNPLVLQRAQYQLMSEYFLQKLHPFSISLNKCAISSHWTNLSFFTLLSSPILSYNSQKHAFFVKLNSSLFLLSRSSSYCNSLQILSPGPLNLSFLQMADDPNSAEINGKSVHFSPEMQIKFSSLTFFPLHYHTFSSHCSIKSSSSATYSIYCLRDHHRAMYRLDRVGSRTNRTPSNISTDKFNSAPAATLAHVVANITAAASSKL